MDRAKAIDKARKLLAMANDASSPNEAATAAKMARRIMDQYQIDDDAILNAEGESWMTIGYNWLVFSPVPDWAGHMAGATAQFNDCQAITVRQNGFQKLAFRGFEDDVLMADQMFNYFYETAVRNEPEPMFMKEKVIEGYYLGFYECIMQRLREESYRRKSQDTVNALMIHKRNMIEEYFEDEELSIREALDKSQIGWSMAKKAGFRYGVKKAAETSLFESKKIGN